MKIKVIFLLTLILMSFSCNQEQKNQELKELLIGEWELCREEPKSEGDIPPPPIFLYSPFGIGFSQDSIEFLNGLYLPPDTDLVTGKRVAKYYGNFVPYQIKRNSIFVLNVLNNKMEFKWKFICLSNDTLKLAVDDSTMLKFKKLENNDIDTIPDFDQIIYSSTGCYGTCRIIDISIDKNSKIFFQGEGYVKELGFYEGQLDDSIKKYVFDKFKKANPLRLEKYYAVSHTDDECITTTYIKNGKIIKTICDYGGTGVHKLTWAYVPIANLYSIVKLKRIPDDEPFYPKYGYYAFEKGRLILPLEKSESFYLWTELKKSKTTSKNFSPTYTITFTGNYTYWGPDANKREHKNEIKKITTDGRFYKFEYKNAFTETYDLGYNFVERNFGKSNFVKYKEGEVCTKC